MNLINVKDRLPDDKTSVLAYGQPKFAGENLDESEPFIVWCVTYESNLNEFSWIVNEHCCIQVLTNVSYWMPLPEKPHE